MARLNQVTLIGYLTADPELKQTPSGASVCPFSIAVNRKIVKEGMPSCDFINIVAWNKTAEFITRFFKKGNLIGIEGSIRTRRYTDKNGANRTAFEVYVNNAQFVESKRDSAAPAAEPASYSNSGMNDFAEIDSGSDDDLPF